MPKVKVLVAQSSPTFWDSMDYSLPGFSVYRILQARILEWVAIPSQPRDRNLVSHIAGRFFTISATREAPHWKRKVGQKGFLNTSCVQWEALITILLVWMQMNNSEDCSTWCILIQVVWLICVHLTSVQSLSHLRLFVTPWTAARQAA